MNNHRLICRPDKSIKRLTKILPTLLSSIILSFILALQVTGQGGVRWQYVATVADGTKTYFNIQVKTFDETNKPAWEKTVKPDGSSIIALVNWNCRQKSRLLQQITFYDSDQTVIGTKKNGFAWTPIIPGSMADRLHQPICDSKFHRQAVEITADRVTLRAMPDNNAAPLRIARSGEMFQLAEETGQNGWFNIVDAKTQEDYWILGNSRKIVPAKVLKPTVTPKRKAKKP